MKRILFLCAGAAAALMAGCSQPSAPSLETGLPAGNYRYESSFEQGGVPMRRAMALTITVLRQGVLYDTLFRQEAGEWIADSVSKLDLQFKSIGDGYHRTIGIFRRGDAMPDTSVAYWRFQNEGDSLYYRVASRFTGNNRHLPGRWKSHAGDTALSGHSLQFDFGNDSVTISGHLHEGTDFSGTYRYLSDADSFDIEGLSLGLGDHYSVTPNFWLYIYNRPLHGFRKVESR